MVEKQQPRRFVPSLNFCRSRISKEQQFDPQLQNSSFWASLTSAQIERIKKFVNKREGLIIDSEDGLKFQCKKGHVWECPLPKLRWCEECAKATYKEKKLKMKREEEQFWEAQAEDQQTLFSQAKRKQSDSETYASSSRKSSIDETLESTIQMQAQEFTSINQNVNFMQAYYVYKVLNMDFNQLRMLCMQNSEYYKLCLEVHPDKNKHPLATEAFQKITIVKNQSY